MTLTAAALLLLLPLAALAILGVPIGLAMAAAGMAYLMVTVDAWGSGAAILFSALDKTPVLAIPFFILAAEILSRGGAMQRLVHTFDCLIGHLPGGMGVVAVISSIVFSAMCGSSIATTAAIGVVVLPELIKRGYSQRFALGLIATSGGLGILIPPSIPLIIYGLVTSESIGALFEAGIVPGLVFGFALCGFVVIRTWNRPEMLRPKASSAERLAAIRGSIDVLLLPVIILGSIYGGIFTPTEASAVAVVYATAITARQFRDRGFRAFANVVSKACVTSAVILMVLSGAAVFAYSLTQSGIPQSLVEWVKSLDLSPIAFLLIVNLILLFLGMFLEVISALLITLPILFPIVLHLWIDPIHFAIIIINMEIAAVTPPIGLNLFTLSAIGRVPVIEVFRGVVPFLGIALAMLGLITYVPALSLVFR
jgi:C4-dicarboxylate transporter, DctM subunit